MMSGGKSMSKHEGFEDVRILYDEGGLAAVYKPPGVTVHPDRTGDYSLVEYLHIHYGGAWYVLHRIDRPVSGVLLMARDRKWTAQYADLFRQHKIEKYYLALTRSRPEEETGELRHWLVKNERMHKAIVVDEGHPRARLAITRYRVLAASEHLYLWWLQPLTGRFHQLRAQLGALSCPIRGDIKYGDKRTNRHVGINLHAFRLQWAHPTDHRPMQVSADPPPYPEWIAFEKIISAL